MKSYKTLKKYAPHKWENDRNWLINRLAFILNTREFNVEAYRVSDICEEKEDFYELHSNLIREAVIRSGCQKVMF